MQEKNSQKIEKFSLRLKGLRGNLGITQGELASELGLSLGTVGNWEAGRNIPQGPLLRKLSEYFKVPVSFLLGEGTPADVNPRLAPNGQGVALKEGATFYGEGNEGVAPVVCGDREAFILVWFGDSMDPKILAGDHLLISPNATLESGDLVMAKKESGEIFVRIYIGRENGMCTLVSYNPVYPAMECKVSDFKFIYPVCQLTRQTKARGLRPLASEQDDGKYPIKPEKVVTP